MNVQESIAEINIDLSSITDPNLKSIIAQFLNIIEHQSKEIKELKEANQKLRDENNRLKAEQGKPNVRLQTKDSKDISSEQEKKRNLKVKNLKLRLTE